MIEPAIAFTLAVTALLGSPGPGIAALLAVGRSRGAVAGLPFYAALQLGLAVAAAISLAGVLSLFQALPWIKPLLVGLSLAYLLWLAWTIASAPLNGGIGGAEKRAFSAPFGFLLGVANPKAYLAFASLFGSFALVEPAFGLRDGLAKWMICMTIILIVDLAWLLVDAALGRVNLTGRAERAMNVVMGGSIVAAGALSIA